jgi:GNAT superfamily N-acetyltransferase
MDIKIYPVKTKSDLRKFIHLPAKIHKNHTNWVPPIYMDDWVFFNPKKNRTFSYCDTILLLASQNGEVVGRVMGIISHKYNESKKENNARFCFLETYDSFDIAKALLENVENWAKSKGTVKLVGPLGFSDKDPQGLLIEGFDEPNVIASNCNFPYLTNLVEKAGFKKEIDLVVYKVMIPEQIPEFYSRILSRAQRNNIELKMLNFKTRNQIKPYVKPVLSLMNETYKEIYGFALMDEKEMNEFASRYLPILDPNFIKVVVNNSNEVIAFILTMPDISDGIIKSKGHLFPFGIFQIFKAQKRTKQLNLLLGAIQEHHRNKGIDTIMGVKILEEAQKAGLKYIDSHLILENNFKMRAEVEKMGGVVYKRYRIFQKALV